MIAFTLACAPRAIVTVSTPAGDYALNTPPALSAVCLVGGFLLAGMFIAARRKP